MSQHRNIVNNRRKIYGFSLLEAIIAVGVLAFGSVFLFQTIINTRKSAKYISLLKERVNVKTILRNKIACNSSSRMNYRLCQGRTQTNPAEAALYDSDGRIIVGTSLSLTEMGSFKLKSSCYQEGRYLHYNIFAKLSGSSASGFSEDWKNINSEFPIECHVDDWFRNTSSSVVSWTECPTFCTSIGLENTQSPDKTKRHFNGAYHDAYGSWCASGEVIPRSARDAIYRNVFRPSPCYWNCLDGSNFDEAVSSSWGRCYGKNWEGGTNQPQDMDSGDFSFACYCSIP